MGSVATWLIYVPTTVASECDGPCFDEWRYPLLPLSIGIGLASAVLAGLLVHLLRSRRRG